MREFLKWFLALTAFSVALISYSYFVHSEGWLRALALTFTTVFITPLMFWYKDKIDEMFE